ncbi:MAG: hypothetical protein RL329_228 [Bacteroidota bacterium]|jgi:hypothetical protein
MFKNIFRIAFLFFCQIGYGQLATPANNILTISGIIQSQISGETLIGAIVSDSIHQHGTIANEYGYFSLPVPYGDCMVKISYIGYESQWISLRMERDTTLKVSLKEYNELKTVEIKAETFEKNGGTGRIELPMAQLAKIPSIGGEKDLVKALITLPGVAGGEEGTASILVRGGGNDQNLFILDGAAVYNTGHLFGFISMFNADAVKKVDLYKNAFPARFGGRLSSILDVHFKEGNKNRFEGKIDVGLISSKLSLEGPIGQKTSFLAAVRSSYLDLFTLGDEKRVLTPSFSKFIGMNNQFVGYTFADGNFKINHTWNECHKTFLNLYIGKDYYRSAQSFGPFNSAIRHELTNATASIRSYHIANPRFFWQWYVAYSRNANQFITTNQQYDYTVTQPNTVLPPTYNFTLADKERYKGIGSTQNASAGVRGDRTLRNHWTLRVGADAIRHFYEPNRYVYEFLSLKDSIPSTRTESPTQYLNATELGAYVENDIRFSKNLEAFIGLRLSHFRQEQQSYSAAEPRFSLNYTLPHHAGVLNLSIAKMQQYQHALIKGGELVDRVVWVPAGINQGQLRPQSAWQYALGWRKSTTHYDFSAECFYKQMSDLSQFRPNLREGNPYKNWENNLLTKGNGVSYGLELFAARKIGKLQGTVAYTWSKSERQFAGLNDGQPFPFLYDRRHNAVLTLSYNLSKQWKMAALWTAANGKRFNLPVAKVLESPFNFDYNIYNEINNAQFPFYHRLDLSFTWEKKLTEHRNWGFNFNIYNAFYKKNIYYIYQTVEYKYDSMGKEIERKEVMKAVSLLPILPSLNVFYHF